MRILFASSEVDPFSKTGGLADVLGALPRALARRGHRCVVVSPWYGDGDVKALGLAPLGKRITVTFPVGRFEVDLWGCEREGVLWVLLVHAGLYERGGIYGDDNGDYGDNALRFAVLSQGALEVCRALGFSPDVVHAHDWQTGLLPLYLRNEKWDRFFQASRSVFTIHNLGYQGRFPKRVMDELGLSWGDFHADGLEYRDTVNLLKSGLCFSDAITTVSPRYAEEIQTHDGGFGLDGVLRARRHRLVGILNGIDTDGWNPATDRALPAHFDSTHLVGKAACHRALCQQLGLRVGPNTLVLGMVTRFAHQKGADLVLDAAHEILSGDTALVVVGSGESRLEEGFQRLSRQYAGRVGGYVGFDPKLARLVFAGADALLMPSRYEPCGLSQLYALRYGTVPIVRATGGLDDTVIDAGLPGGTGFKFDALEPWALAQQVQRATGLFRRRDAWAALVRRGMSQDFSWDASCGRYLQLFHRLGVRS